MQRTAIPCIVFLLAAAPALGAANGSLQATFVSADPACDTPIYTITGTADATSDDDGLGNDHIALVMHDGSGNYVDVDYAAVQTPNDGFAEVLDFVAGDPTFASFLSSRPITVRLHDIPDPSVVENSKAGLELASSSLSVLAEIQIDPGLDDPACMKPFHDHSLRIESLERTLPTIVGASDTTLHLDDGLSTELTIAAPGPSVLAAFYRAECAHDAANEIAYVEADILVNGVPIPANDDDAFCSGDGEAGFSRWLMGRTMGTAMVDGPAVHSLQVRAQSVNGGMGRIQDTELVVMLPEPDPAPTWIAALALLLLLARHDRRRRYGLRRGFRLLAAFVLSGGVGLSGAPASAETWIQGSSSGETQTYLHSEGRQLIMIADERLNLPLTLPRPARVSLFFTAECTVNAASTSIWLDLDLIVDTTRVVATDTTGDAFCTSDGGGQNNWLSPSIHATIDLDAGFHNFLVEGGLQGGAGPSATWTIDDASLVIVAQEY